MERLRLGKNELTVTRGTEARRCSRGRRSRTTRSPGRSSRDRSRGLRLQHDPGRARRAAGRQPGRRGLPGAEPGRQHGRAEPDCSATRGRLPLPQRRRVPTAAAAARAGGHGADHHDRRPHRDYVVRRERGTINRFIYSFAMLAPAGPAGRPARHAPGTGSWSTGSRRRRHRPPAGNARQRALDPALLGRGYAIVDSRHAHERALQPALGGETALMTKEQFIERYGVPLYTVGVGGSGGAIQQYMYGQNHRGCSTPASRSTPIPTWSRRRSTSATASCSSTTWTSPTPPTRSGGTGTTARG